METDYLNQPMTGYLEIFQGDELITTVGSKESLRSGSNIILDHYRKSIARLAIDEDGDTNTSNNDFGGDIIRIYNKVDSRNRRVDSVIPYWIALDDEGVELDAYNVQTVKTPNIDDYVGKTGPIMLQSKYEDKFISDLAPNIITCRFILGNHEGAADQTFSRATLASRDGQPVATKCFKRIKKGEYGLTFNWSLAY